MRTSVRFVFVSLVTPLLLAHSAAAADARRTMTPVDLARLHRMSDVRISPDAAHIAAVRTVPRELFADDDGPAWKELYLIERDTGVARPFVTGDVEVEAVDWRPDSSAISFLATRGDDDDQKLYVIPVDGGEATPVLSLGTSAVGYDWSPDGRKVAVIATDKVTEEEEALVEHGFDQEVFEEDFQPLGLFIADLDGTATTERLDLDGSVIDVRWSPDGERLAVALAPTPLVDDRYMNQVIEIVSVPTGEVVGTVERAGKLGALAWSPDGELLAMISAADLHDPSASSLMVVPAIGGAARNLTPGFHGSVADLAWLDDRVLIALADVGVRTELYRVGTAGEPLEPLGRIDDAAVYTGLSLADDGRHGALIGSAPTHPSEVFALDLESESAPKRVTDANPWLRGVRLAKQEVVRWTARDGVELEGLLLRPLDEPAERRAPLIMIVHGGPEGHRRDGWLTRYNAPAQVLAGRGYAVFFPNYRGSTGRGVEFSKLGQGDAAGAEFDDLIDGIDHLVASGVADPERIGVTGGSYGGYATAWLATRFSERFAAGVMFVGISNKISKFGTTDIPEEETLVHALAYPWQKWRYFLERSPLFYVENGRTPLLIMGGDADPRVSPTQSNELYRALKTLGRAPVRLVRYPGEGHGNRRGAARFDYQLRLLRWFDQFVRGHADDLPPYRLDYRSPEHGWAGHGDGPPAL
jgi:dipeptidyl aminopeptidase/acylaminoacyl peptidase